MSSATPGGDEHINGASVALQALATDDGTPPAVDEPAPVTPPAAEAPRPPADPPVDDAAPVGEEVLRRDLWRRLLGVAVVLVAALAVVVLWARPAHEPAGPPLVSPPDGGLMSVSLNPTDLAYLQLMISLDNSALPLFDAMRDMPALQAVAASAADGHKGELVALRAALSAGGALEDPSLHAGHDLPGIVLDADLAAIRDAPADQRPAKAVALLREHLTAAVSLSTSEGQNGFDPATKAAAAQIRDAHTELLAALPTV
ncbi:hypothetical protein [Dactylosporangium sp. CA-092794]|uniref:hypothetical protein n=1 Tax=Dactylosporangium sp. CA-092794 TaxID=3239929 RepID=UPI003D8D5B4D